MKRTKSSPHVNTGGNLALALAMQGKGGNLTHDPRPRRMRTRASQRRNAIREQS